MDYPLSPRLVTRTTRTPVLTSSDCPGLTEIKDVRIHNNLLEEIFNVEDSIELDYFELERQEANFDNYLSGYSSPPNTRLSLELRQDETGHYRGTGVESNGYQLHELQSRRVERRDSATGISHAKGPSVTRPGTYENGGCELVAVASPTISSTCEGGLTCSAASGIGNISSNSPRAVAVSDVASVHSTTNAAGSDSTAQTDAEKVQLCNKELVDEKPPPTILEPAQGYGMRGNVRPRVENRSRNVNPSQQMVSVNGTCLSPAAEINGDPVVPPSSASGLAPGGDSTTASSSSTSPSQLHVTKRQRVIDCGSDLLAEVRQAYEYVQGADLYAPSFHPTFTKLDVAAVPSAFQPNTDKNGQPSMNFNFAGQTGSVPVAFVGNGRVVDGQKGAILQQAGMPYPGSRNTGSPSVNYQSCPDLVSPGRPQVQERVAYSRHVPQRPLAEEPSTASLSAPTTPSKRAGPWSVNAQQWRSQSPSVQGQWRPGVSVPREHMVPMQLNRQNVAVNSGPSLSAPIPLNDEQTGCDNVYDPYAQRFGTFSRPQSPGHGRAAFHNADRPRSQHMQPPVNYPGSIHMPAPDALRMGEGTPLSQNAFLRSVVDDESLVFRSHPLFPLLRDIIIADMNFHTPSFPFQLIANLPADFHRLVQNYIQRNPHLASVTVPDRHTESVVMDALAYAHAALIGR